MPANGPTPQEKALEKAIQKLERTKHELERATAAYKSAKQAVDELFEAMEKSNGPKNGRKWKPKSIGGGS